MKLNLSNFNLSSGGIISIAVSGVALLLGYISKKHTEESRKRLDGALHDIVSNGAELHVDQELVNKCVKDKAEKETVRMMPECMADARREASRIFREEIQKEISSQYTDIKASVKEKVAAKVGAIDVSDIRKEIVEAGKHEIKQALFDDISQMKRDFKDDLDDIIDDLKDDAEDKIEDKIGDIVDRFDRRLDDVTRIYSRVANKIERS